MIFDMSAPSVKSETDLMQDCMTALLVETRRLDAIIAGKTAETADMKAILEFDEKIREIHSRLAVAFSPSEGRSRILERFFVQWNNMLFGAFYVTGELSTRGFVTKRQMDILIQAMEEIKDSLGKNPIIAKRATSDEGQPQG